MSWRNMCETQESHWWSMDYEWSPPLSSAGGPKCLYYIIIVLVIDAESDMDSDKCVLSWGYVIIFCAS